MSPFDAVGPWAAERIVVLVPIIRESGRLRRGAEARGGIGLALVKRLVDLHRGCISVSSRGAGHGTTFTLRLPSAAAHEP